LLWRQGLPMSVMASRLGCSRSLLGGLISRHRRQGGTLFPRRAAGAQHGGARPGPRPPQEKAIAEPRRGLGTAKLGLKAVHGALRRPAVLAALRARRLSRPRTACRWSISGLTIAAGPRPRLHLARSAIAASGSSAKAPRGAQSMPQWLGAGRAFLAPHFALHLRRDDPSDDIRDAAVFRLRLRAIVATRSRPPDRRADSYGARGVSSLTSRAGLSSRKPTKTVWRRRPSSGQLR
jgi:hypothetical protein